MKPFRRLSSLAVLAAFTLLSASAWSDKGTPECLVARTEAVYRNYGYDHLVHIDNGCDKAAECSVKTNANPDPIQVDVPVKRTVTVLTFRGSPAREFTAEVRCSLKK